MTINPGNLTNNMIHDKINDAYLKNSSSLYKASKMMSESKKYDDFADLERDGLTNNFIRANTELNSLKNYSRTNNIISNRLETLFSAMEQIMTEAQDSIEVGLSQNGPLGNEIDLNVIFNKKLESLQYFLNQSDSYGKMFAGTNTDQEAVGDIVNNSNIVNGKVTDNYILTNQVIVHQKISDSQTIAVNVSAGEKAFQNLIASYHMMLDENTVNQGRALMEKSYEELNSLKAEIGYRIDNVRKTNEHNEEKLEVIQNQHQQFQIDIPIAHMEFIEKQLQLQNTQAISMKLYQHQNDMIELFKNL